MNFHEIRFPVEISRGSHGGPERRTDVVVLGSGFEERNSRWADSRRRYDAGYGVKSLDDLHQVTAFFEERRGKLYGFRWKDHADWKSSPPQQTPAQDDVVLGTGDGTNALFQLIKIYGNAHAPWTRKIAKPVQGSVLVAVDGVLQGEGSDYTVDYTTGMVTFQAGSIPAAAARVTAGFEFDVPVRFDTDKLEVSVRGLGHGAIPAIPVVEVRL